MAIRQTSGTNIDEQLRRATEIAKQKFMLKLQYIGEQCVRKARTLPNPPASVVMENGKLKNPMPPHQPNYLDRTANLRSSIGYVIVVDGKIEVESAFNAVKGGSEGASKGRDFAHKIASEFPSGIALIVVAGMNYSSYVQRRGYDVTASAELLADQLLKQLNIPATVKHM